MGYNCFESAINHFHLQKGPKKNAMKASLMAVGFNFYLILARLIDVDPHMTESRLKFVIS